MHPLDTEAQRVNDYSHSMIAAYLCRHVSVGDEQHLLYNDGYEFVNLRDETASSCLRLVENNRIPDAFGLGFRGGVGKTSRADDFTSLINGVSERLFDVYDDDTWFYPRHANDSRLGAERPHVSEWRERGW